jgi:hypothetical protein
VFRLLFKLLKVKFCSSEEGNVDAMTTMDQPSTDHQSDFIDSSLQGPALDQTIADRLEASTQSIFLECDPSSAQIASDAISRNDSTTMQRSNDCIQGYNFGVQLQGSLSIICFTEVNISAIVGHEPGGGLNDLRDDIQRLSWQAQETSTEATSTEQTSAPVPRDGPLVWAETRQGIG